MRIIPAIDIIDGKCVRLTKGDYRTKKVYNEDPLEVAKAFEAFGINYLHLVDLDGAKAKQIMNYKVLEKIAARTRLNIDFGGGLKRDEDVKIAFNSGANQITAGSIAATRPEMVTSWLKKYGAEKVILGADAKNRKIATHGWENHTELDVVSYIKDYSEKGIRYVICTDIDKDGMLAGVSAELYKEILAEANVNLIASGGVSQLSDLDDCEAIGCEAVIIGKAIYEGNISLKQLSQRC